MDVFGAEEVEIARRQPDLDAGDVVLGRVLGEAVLAQDFLDVGLGAPAPVDKGFVGMCCIAGLQAQHPGELVLEVGDCVGAAGAGALGDRVVVRPVAFGRVVHAEDGRSVEPPVRFVCDLYRFALGEVGEGCVHRAHGVGKSLEERCEQLVGAGGVGEEGVWIGPEPSEAGTQVEIGAAAELGSLAHSGLIKIAPLLKAAHQAAAVVGRIGPPQDYGGDVAGGQGGERAGQAVQQGGCAAGLNGRPSGGLGHGVL